VVRPSVTTSGLRASHALTNDMPVPPRVRVWKNGHEVTITALV